MKSTPSGRLERWVGTARLNEISQRMRGWPGPPIHLLDVPGSVRVCGDGDFIGPFERGYFASAADALHDHAQRLLRSPVTYGQFGVGFASVADYLERARGGHQQTLRYSKGPANIAGGCGWSLWASANGVPAAGAAGSAAPGGRAPTSTTLGGLPFNNPASGTLRLTGADFTTGSFGFVKSVLLYDRIFDVAKTMNSTDTEAVTGVPTRYQSPTVTAEDYAGGNFLFTECHTTLGAGVHNWTVCTYLNEAGNASTLPSLLGINTCILQRHDMSVNQWFAPLASGDVGVKALTQMQCDALITPGAVNFVIGHPIGFISSPIGGIKAPLDWLTNRNQAPRVFDDACLAIVETLASSNGFADINIELTAAP